MERYEKKRDCADCPWCVSIETKLGRIVYICADEDGGNFLGETGLLGWCVPNSESNEDMEEEIK